jgi:hypothetical protein
MLELGFESWDGSAEQSKADSGSLPHPAFIGRYRVLHLVGEGGMGAVYEADQDSPRRTVALKIIKPSIASPELLRRFEQESQALGRLQHPGIAQIYEGGTLDLGFGPQPYFAMEFIRGLPPREYAETHHLNTRDRLQIMVKICDAVHHAHQRGIIHRDLKPANILVDQTGQPKILDFGVARVTDSDARATYQTNVGQLVGTLAYMSPEQALADPLDIDTRSDVYALGVILYELLSGQLPYTINRKIHEAIQTIREQDPAPLGVLNREFRGDIETIAAKALEKERERRYASAAEMAADIQRCLNDEPIVARPASAVYQLRKFARRNRPLVAGVAVVVAVLIVGTSAIAWYATQATKDRDRALKAETRANVNEQVAIQAGARETELRHVAEDLRLRAEKQTIAAQDALSASEVNLYLNNIALADREWIASNIAHVDQLLAEAPVALRNWEWHYFKRLNHMEEAVLSGHQATVVALTLSSDAKRFRSVAVDGTFKDWDLNSRKEIASGTIGRSFIPRPFGTTLSIDGKSIYLDHALAPTPTRIAMIQEILELSTGKAVFSLPALRVVSRP